MLPMSSGPLPGVSGMTETRTMSKEEGEDGREKEPITLEEEEEEEGEDGREKGLGLRE